MESTEHPLLTLRRKLEQTDDFTEEFEAFLANPLLEEGLIKSASQLPYVVVLFQLIDHQEYLDRFIAKLRELFPEDLSDETSMLIDECETALEMAKIIRGEHVEIDGDFIIMCLVDGFYIRLLVEHKCITFIDRLFELTQKQNRLDGIKMKRKIAKAAIKYNQEELFREYL